MQTHLDVDLQTLPTAYTYFAKLDFVRAILFSNSPDFDKKRLPLLPRFFCGNRAHFQSAATSRAR
ncbi:MAG: hypothetical protein L6V93_18635 [Clostridiales bacterium]|nr:MAG: hypothetical protein L6V93_18635 [Clostridiales bacterium]